MASGWSPLRHAVFRRLWLAQLASNLGGWMQTVGAQWLMLSLTSSAAFLAFIQSAASLPVLLFAIPAGAVGDLVDRRKLLLISQAFMLLASLVLAVLAATDHVTRWSLLALLFAVGSGQAWTSPTWQSLQPELVPADERSQAIALGSVNQNLARAVGPAIGGALVAATNPSLAFFVNAATFLAVIGAVATWRETRRRDSTVPPEHVRAAIRASGRYVFNSRALRAVLVRTAAFIGFASALWALLPSIAHTQLGLGSGGYGLLLGCVGAGAVSGAFVLPLARGKLSPDALLALAALAVAIPTALLALVHVVAVAAVVLVVAGLGWILALATLNSTYQSLLPGWVKARALAYYLIVFQGGMAIGSAVLGLLAVSLGVTEVMTGAAILLAIVPAAVSRRWPIPAITPAELLPSGDEPHAEHYEGGPVMVTIERRGAGGARGGCVRAAQGAATHRRDRVERLARRDRRDPRAGAVRGRLMGGPSAPDRAHHGPRQGPDGCRRDALDRALDARPLASVEQPGDQDVEEADDRAAEQDDDQHGPDGDVAALAEAQ